MKFVSLFLALLTLPVLADQKYLVTRQPTTSTQVGEVVNVPPNGVFIADSTGKLVPRLLTSADIFEVWGPGSTIKTFAQLKTALLDPTVKRMVMGADIRITENIIVTFGKVVAFNGRKWIENSTQTVQFYGVVEANREQIFQGWEPGDITGSFGIDAVFPEWWGMTGSTSADGKHDEAINCAIRSFDGEGGHTVSLAHGTYWVSKPIDLRGYHCRLKGAGSGNTYIKATTDWAPDVWEDCDFFAWTKEIGKCTFSAAANSAGSTEFTTQNGGTVEYKAGRNATITNASNPAYNGVHYIEAVTDHNTIILGCTYIGDSTGSLAPVTLDSVMESGTRCHSAMIWMGGDDFGASQTFHTGVEGMNINAYYPTVAWPLKRVSAISWTGYVEELSPIHDVVIVNFSGFGIGGSHPSSVNVVNGVTIENFAIAASTRRGSVPIYLGTHSGVHSVRDGTIDMRIVKSLTEFADVPVTYKSTWPQFGILAAGAHSLIESVHIEGVSNGIHVFAWEGPGSVSVRNCDMRWGMEPKMGWYDDPVKIDGPPPSTATQEAEDSIGNQQDFVFHQSCLVSIGRLPLSYHSADNYNSNVVCENLRVFSKVKYIVRDWVYGVEVTTVGNERLPNGEAGGITSYKRGIPYGLPTGTWPSMVEGDYYDKNSPATDKTYFNLIR